MTIMNVPAGIHTNSIPMEFVHAWPGSIGRGGGEPSSTGAGDATLLATSPGWLTLGPPAHPATMLPTSSARLVTQACRSRPASARFAHRWSRCLPCRASSPVPGRARGVVAAPKVRPTFLATSRESRRGSLTVSPVPLLPAPDARDSRTRLGTRSDPPPWPQGLARSHRRT